MSGCGSCGGGRSSSAAAVPAGDPTKYLWEVTLPAGQRVTYSTPVEAFAADAGRGTVRRIDRG